jgi:glycosyltransferase involved in cell wall biosynthesis
MNSPRVTVAMAVYNVAPFVGEAVQSVLEQSFQDFELLVVNDGSTDGSDRMLRAFDDHRIRVLDQENQGIARTRNRLLSEALGEYIAVFDPDDVMLPGRLERQSDLLCRQREIGIVGGQAVQITEDGYELSRCVTYPTDAQAIHERCTDPRMSILHGTSMFRASIARELGGYREAFGSIQEDFEFFSRILSRHLGANLPCPVIKYRLRRSSAVGANSHLMPKRVELVRRQFARMRAGGAELSGEELVELQRSDGVLVRRTAASNGPGVSADGRYWSRVGRAALRGRQWSAARRAYVTSLVAAPHNWVAYAGVVRSLFHAGGGQECESGAVQAPK